MLWMTASISFRAVRTVSLELADWKNLGEFGIGDLDEKIPEEFHVEADLGMSMDCNLELEVFSLSSATIDGELLLESSILSFFPTF